MTLSVNMIIHLKQGKATDFAVWRFLIYHGSNWRQTICLWEFFRSWTSFTITKMKKSYPRHRCICVIFKLATLQICFFYCKLFFLKLVYFLEITITTSDFSNSTCATWFKLLFWVDIFLGILQELRNNFLKEHLRKTASTAFHKIKIKGFDLRESF